MTYKLMEEAKIADSLKPSMKVGIKPNLVVARPAVRGGHHPPQIVEGIIRYVLDAGVKDITVLEGSWVGDSTKRAFVNCGIPPSPKNTASSSTTPRRTKRCRWPARGSR
jgi:uncharacterized protein (DUF362 family)